MESEPLTELEWLKTYRDTVHAVYAYVARRTGGNRELTEDVVQESYLRALHSWNPRTLPDFPLAWLKRVARNILIDYLRHQGRDAKVDLARQPDIGHPNSEDTFHSLEIFSAISSLGMKKARVLEAFYYEGMSVGEIAEEMAISERAVEGQLRRARRSLKSLLPDLKSNGGNNA